MESVELLLGLVENDLVLALLLFAGTTALVACCVPGAIVGMSVSSASLLGNWLAMPVVAAGALVGSLILFLTIRHADAGRARRRLGSKLHTIEKRFVEHGAWYIVGLRLLGAPHFLVTAASALLPLRASTFAAATVAGLLPAIAIAAAAGGAL